MKYKVARYVDDDTPCIGLLLTRNELLALAGSLGQVHPGVTATGANIILRSLNKEESFNNTTIDSPQLYVDLKNATQTLY